MYDLAVMVVGTCELVNDLCICMTKNAIWFVTTYLDQIVSIIHNYIKSSAYTKGIIIVNATVHVYREVKLERYLAMCVCPQGCSCR